MIHAPPTHQRQAVRTDSFHGSVAYGSEGAARLDDRLDALASEAELALHAFPADIQRHVIVMSVEGGALAFAAQWELEKGRKDIPR